VGRTIVFLSDYGLDDEFVGVCHGVIAGIAPGARVIDLTHGIPSQDVTRGGMVLAQNCVFFPEGSVFLSVVDPGVGSARRGIAVETERGDVLIGPDNGLLSLAWDALGGLRAAVKCLRDARKPVLRLGEVHGRDVFAPAAAHVANGAAVSDLGPEYPVSDLVRLELPSPEVQPGSISAPVLSLDRYGNIELAARAQELEAAGLHEAGEVAGQANESRFLARRVRTFADLRPGELGTLVDSLGWVAIVLNGGNAAEALGVGPGDFVDLTAG
jgi:S-adenosylmethionine hydrolase